MKLDSITLGKTTQFTHYSTFRIAIQTKRLGKSKQPNIQNLFHFTHISKIHQVKRLVILKKNPTILQK